MPTLSEILAARAAAAAPAAPAAPKNAAPVLTAAAGEPDAVEKPLPPPTYQPITGRLAGFPTLGDQIPMEWPDDWQGEKWKEARHSLAENIGIVVDAEGQGWIVLFRKKTDFPIFLHGPLFAVVCPF